MNLGDTNIQSAAPGFKVCLLMNLWWLSGGEVGEGLVRESGMDMYTLLYLKMDNQQGPTVEHGELCSMFWQPGWEGSLRENGYMYI